MASFPAEILLTANAKVVLNEIDKIEKRINEVNSKFSFGTTSSPRDRAAARKKKELLEADRELLQNRAEELSAENRLLKSYNTRQRRARFIADQAERTADENERAADQLERQARIEKAARQRRADTAALGIGFPLLFGGGIGSVAGGALGGVLGTIGGGSGFGAQILASAIGTQVEAFATATAEAGQALNSTSGAFDLLTEKSLFSSEETERLANQLAELGEVEKLATLLTKDLVDIIGNEGVEKLQTLGDTTNETTRLWGQLTLQLQALISGPLNGFLSLVNDFLGRIVNPARYRNLIRENPEARARAEELRGPRRGRDAAKNRGLTEAQIQAQILKEFDPIVTVDIPVTPEDRTRFAPPTPKAPGVDKAAREEARIQERLAQLRIETELIKDQTALIQEQTTARIDNNKLNQIDIEALVKSVELEARKQRT